MTWESARFNAAVLWNVQVGKKDKVKEQDLRLFAWEDEIIDRKSQAIKVQKDALRFRNVVKNKWGLKYLNE